MRGSQSGMGQSYSAYALTAASAASCLSRCHTEPGSPQGGGGRDAAPPGLELDAGPQRPALLAAPVDAGQVPLQEPVYVGVSHVELDAGIAVPELGHGSLP